MNKEYFVAKHIPSGKLLKFEELYDDGFGVYQPTVLSNEFDLTDETARPSLFNVPRIPHLAIVCESTGRLWRKENSIPMSDIQFLKVLVTITIG